MRVEITPDESAVTETTSGIWQQILDTLIAYGKEDLANQIIGAYQSGVSKREIAQKLLAVIGSDSFAIWNMIIRVPEDYNFDETEWTVKPGLAIELIEMDTCWPSATMAGTHPVSGYRLIHLCFRSSANRIVWLIELLKTLYALPWTIMALQTVKPVESYMDGEDTKWRSRVAVSVNPQVFLAVNRRPQYDTDGTTIIADPDPDVTWLSGYSGHEHWQ